MLREAEVFAVSAVWSGFQRWYPLALVFGIAMACDYISGILAAKKEALVNPDNAELGLSSKKGIKGIIKKFGYILLVGTAFTVDFLLHYYAEPMGLEEHSTFFGVLTLIWLTANELLSVLENLGRMGVPIPSWLRRIIRDLRAKGEEGEEKK